jgi:hypothetical protein
MIKTRNRDPLVPPVFVVELWLKYSPSVLL